ncbi:MAG: thioredoxin fold domain-containing protein [Chitinophagaceae bacterium]|nr:thioredoxin fold domain-containing protein [Chitinophagaceae bacterium]
MRPLLFLFIFFAAGCTSSAQTATEVNAAIFEKDITAKAVQLLDVRTAGEYRNGHIKGALQANWNNEQEFKERTAALDKNNPVYVYCLSGGRSQAAAAWLRSNGFKNVVELEGGFSSWKRNNKPFEGMPDEKPLTMQEYQQHIAGKEYVLVDFGAEWCPPCKKMEPVINDFLAAHKEIFFYRIDGGVHTNLMKQLNAEGLPTFLFLKNGVEVWRYKGILSLSELQAMWQQKK